MFKLLQKVFGKSDKESDLGNHAFHAILREDIDDLIMLLKKGADVNSRDKLGRTLLINSVIEHNLQMVTLLLEKGADVNAKDKNGFTALHFAAQEYLPDIAKLLINSSSEIDSQNVYGNTPLFTAVSWSRGRGDLIKLLLLHGADRNLKNFHGVSPFSLAQSIANYDVKRYFEV
ncbi:MAG TPA: ankyrin repeat domain-containing protein [Alphaproteobacteria bacterium]|jgi:ankyrin repeat protein|nr:ankyrin repeat domain-containing protein [Alphaproteobacteria bacterium]